MSHHAHFVGLSRQERSLARTFGAAHRRCTRMVNFREGRRGPLWNERFHSCSTDERRASEKIGLIFSSWPLPFGLSQRTLWRLRQTQIQKPLNIFFLPPGPRENPC